MTTSYDAASSWGLFAACDRDSDDRLDIFEANAGIVGLDDPKEAAPFRKLDLDSDGFLSWSEFNRRYLTAIQSQGRFRVKPSRPFELPLDPTKSQQNTALDASLLRFADSDDDGTLSPPEYRSFVVKSELDDPPEFRSVDVDGSGSISRGELRAVLDQIPDRGVAILTRFARDPNRLPPEMRPADANHDNSIDVGELSRALIAIDPSLRRWSTRVLRDADYSGNDQLGTPEITRALADKRPTGQ